MNCDEKELELARKILSWSRRRIAALCPLLLPAVYALQERVPETPGPMSTDGVHLWFWPEQVIADFRQDKDLPAQRLLHITLHCLLGHLSMRQEQRKLSDPALPGEFADLPAQQRAGLALAVFDCVADQKAAYWMDLLCGGDFYDDCCFHFADQPLARLYREVLTDPKGIKFSLKYAPDCALDDHGMWSPPAQLVIGTEAELPAGWEAPDWTRLRAQMALQAAESPRWGHLAGKLESEFRMEEDSSVSYTQFLRRFAAPAERLLSDPDSLDFRWYHLGLEMYGDIPLLEPTELSEPPLPDDLVIAVDTSGSCDGETCRRFLRETASLLRDISAGADSFRILLLQCDEEIQQELLLTSPDQLARLSEELHPQGFGGTDFRPVFRRVEELRQDGTLPRVRGLLYLSDGWGDYPKQAPDYPAAFLIPEEEQLFSEIPKWVTILQLNTDGFTVKEASV